jgi:hypothetical protein
LMKLGSLSRIMQMILNVMYYLIIGVWGFIFFVMVIFSVSYTQHSYDTLAFFFPSILKLFMVIQGVRYIDREFNLDWERSEA